MAYKFQLGPATMSGSLLQEGDLTLASGQSFIIGNASMNEADLEKLDGITNGAGAADKALVLNSDADIVSGVRNIVLSGDVECSRILGANGLVLDNTDLLKLDGVSDGTAAANKALVVDGNGDIGAIRILRTTNNIEAGAILSGAAGLQLGVGAGALISAQGGAVALSATDLLQIDGITAGTAAASKALVLDSSKKIGGITELTASTISASNVHVAASTITVGGVAIDAAEIAVLNDVTAGTVAAGKAVVVDSNKDAASFRNLTAAGAVTAGSFVIGSANISEAELEQIDGITAGTVAASKAVVVDSNKDADGFRNVTATGAFIIGSANMDETDLEKLDGITNGTAAANKALVVDGNLDIGVIRDVRTTRAVETATLSASAGLTLGVGGGALISAQGGAVALSAADLLQIDGITAGTAAANKALVVDNNLDIGVIRDVRTTRAVETATLSASAGLTLGVCGGALISAQGGAVALSATDLLQIDGITAGAGAANKALVLDSNADIVSGLRSIVLSGDVEIGNRLMGGSGGTAFELNAADLVKLDGITDGAGAANKALILDSNADIASGLRNVTLSGDLQVGGLSRLGNASSDGVAISGSLITNLMPMYNKEYEIGSSSKEFKAVYARDFYGNLTNDSVEDHDMPSAALSASVNIIVGGAMTVILPTAKKGKRVTVKRGISSSGTVRVTCSSGIALDEHEGFNHIDLESEGAAVTFIGVSNDRYIII